MRFTLNRSIFLKLELTSKSSYSIKMIKSDLICTHTQPTIRDRQISASTHTHTHTHTDRQTDRQVDRWPLPRRSRDVVRQWQQFARLSELWLRTPRSYITTRHRHNTSRLHCSTQPSLTPHHDRSFRTDLWLNKTQTQVLATSHAAAAAAAAAAADDTHIEPISSHDMAENSTVVSNSWFL